MSHDLRIKRDITIPLQRAHLSHRNSSSTRRLHPIPPVHIPIPPLIHLIETNQPLNHTIRIHLHPPTPPTTTRPPRLSRRSAIIAQRTHGRGLGGGFLAVGAVFDDEADGLFDADPVEFLGDGGGRFIDAAVLRRVHGSSNLILTLRIAHHLFILQHQPFAQPALIPQQFIMRSRAPQPAFLRAIRAAGIGAVFEVVADFVEAFLGDEVLALGAEVAAVDDGVDEVVGGGAQVAAGFDAADAFEAEGVPDAAGGDVGFVDEVEDGVGVALDCNLGY